MYIIFVVIFVITCRYILHHDLFLLHHLDYTLDNECIAMFILMMQSAQTSSWQ